LSGDEGTNWPALLRGAGTTPGFPNERQPLGLERFR
jgi:hypothetical protein